MGRAADAGRKERSEMDRLTTDNPKTNFEAMLNMVYSKDEWGYIRHNGASILASDFVLGFCERQKCAYADGHHRMNRVEKDQLLTDCAYFDCPAAAVYAALTGFFHVRSRLKMYEDAGMWPSQGQPAQKPLEWEAIPDHQLVYLELRGIDKPIPSILRQTMDDQAWYTMESGSVFTFAMEELGKSWRAWAQKPTDEERSATEWM
jgi:hypothetical protein